MVRQAEIANNVLTLKNQDTQNKISYPKKNNQKNMNGNIDNDWVLGNLN